MNSKEIKKVLKPNNNGLWTSLCMLLIALILIVVGTSLGELKDDKVAIDYGTLISSKQDKSGEYVKVNINYLPYLFAEENDNYGGKKYYIIFDQDGYPYIARLTDKTYQYLETKYDNQEPISYELKGYLFKQEKELKALAIDGHKEIFEDSQISENNYELYFGNCYIDETLTPSTGVEAITIGLGVGLIILSTVFFIIYIVSIIRFNHNIKKYNKDDLQYELAKNNTLYYKKLGLSLTDNYIISTMLGLDILKYDDIIWLYNENRRYNFVSIGWFLIARTNDKKMRQLACTFRDESLLIEIMNKIYEKNNKIMIGFTKENQKQYKELTKKK